ncbi:SIR2 family protein, partial [Providencia stuartii]|nr:SIR2 family protein [Providencia stuartii]
YMYQTKSEMMENYFKIIDESNQQLIELLNKQKIQTSQFFPIFAFSEICSALENVIEYKEQQIRKLIEHYIKTDEKRNCENRHEIIEDILNDASIPNSKKSDCIFHSYYNNKITDNQIKNYLLNYGDKTSTDYRRLLCLYDYKIYGV